MLGLAKIRCGYMTPCLAQSGLLMFIGTIQGQLDNIVKQNTSMIG